MMQNLPWLIKHFQKVGDKIFSAQEEDLLLQIIEKSSIAEEIVLALQLLAEDDETKILPLCQNMQRLSDLNLQILIAVLGTCESYEILQHLINFYLCCQNVVNKNLSRESILRAKDLMSVALLFHYKDEKILARKEALATLLQKRGLAVLTEFLTQSQTIPFEVELRSCFGDKKIDDFLEEIEKNNKFNTL